MDKGDLYYIYIYIYYIYIFYIIYYIIYNIYYITLYIIYTYYIYYIYIYIYYNYIHVIYIYIYIHIYTKFECFLFWIPNITLNTTRNFYKIVIFWVLRIFNRLTNKKCKKIYINRILTKWKEQYIYLKERW